MERDRHPDPELLERFMRNQAQPSDRLWIVRHLLAGCQKCTAVTRELWSLGDPPRAQHRQPSTASAAMAPTLVPMPFSSPRQPGHRAPQESGARRPDSLNVPHAPSAHTPPNTAYDDIFSRFADLARQAHQVRQIDAERASAPRLVAELLASPAAVRAALAPHALASSALSVPPFPTTAHDAQDAHGASADDVTDSVSDGTGGDIDLSAGVGTSAFNIGLASGVDRASDDRASDDGTDDSISAEVDSSLDRDNTRGQAEVRGPEVGDPSGIDSGLAPRPVDSGLRFRTPAVCDLLLERSRTLAEELPRTAAERAELALALAGRLDTAVCGASVVLALRSRAWAHLGHARRHGGDLEGAATALALAAALASGFSDVRSGARPTSPTLAVPPPLPAASPLPSPAPESPTTASPLPALPPLISTVLEPVEQAELMTFQAGLRASLGDLAVADRLLARAVELYAASEDAVRTGHALIERGRIQADLGNPASAAASLREGISRLDAAGSPDIPSHRRVIAAALNDLALQLYASLGEPAAQPCALAAGPAAIAGPPAEPAAAPSVAAAPSEAAAPSAAPVPSAAAAPSSTGALSFAAAPSAAAALLSAGAPSATAASSVAAASWEATAPSADAAPSSTAAPSSAAAPSAAAAPWDPAAPSADAAVPAGSAVDTDAVASIDRGVSTGRAATASWDAAGRAGSFGDRCREALQAVVRARTLLAASAGSASAVTLARLELLRGRIEAAVGDLEAAAATLAAAALHLAQLDLGREAALARIAHADVQMQLGRVAEPRRLRLDEWPPRRRNDRPWDGFLALWLSQIQMERQAEREAGLRELASRATPALYQELGRFLAAAPRHAGPRFPSQAA